MAKRGQAQGRGKKKVTATSARKGHQTKTKKSAAKDALNKHDAQPRTDTFVDLLPVRQRATDVAEGVPAAGVMRAGDPRSMLYVVYEATAVQPGLFQTFGGTPTHEETDILTFAGKRRYWIKNSKIRGVTRRILADYADPAECTPMDPCGECTVCNLFGYRAQADDGRSRATFFDAWSIEEAQPVVENSRTVRGNPFLRNATLVPVGTRFMGALRIRYAAQSEVADLIESLEHAFTEGIGARTTTHGSMAFRPLAIMGGIWKSFSTVTPILERIDRGMDVCEATRDYLASISRGLPAATCENVQKVLDSIGPLSTLHPNHGRYGCWEAA